MTVSTSRSAIRSRERRLEEGRRSREAEQASFTRGGKRVPTHKQLILPLLETIMDHGGSARPADIYEDVAARVNAPQDALTEEVEFANGRRTNLWTRHIRWARQTAVEMGLLSDKQWGVWEIAGKGREMLKNIRRGVVVTVFTTDSGVCLWANAEDAAAVIKPGSLDLIFTSSPFPVVTDRRGYGTMDTASWLDWMVDLGEAWKTLLKPTGSIMMHLGDSWYRGTPTLSPYIERFTIRMIDDVGLHLAEKFYAEHPTRLPAPRPWVAIKRVRVKPSVDPILWFSVGENPKASNLNVLVPYSESTRRNYIGNPDAKGGKRPSGHDIGNGSFAADNGGAIPGNLIRCIGQDEHVRTYRKACREAGLPLHPAVMPREMAEFGIRLTTDKGDLVYDPFFGSGTTGHVAESLGRHWIGSERSLVYAKGAALRFPDASMA